MCFTVVLNFTTERDTRWMCRFASFFFYYFIYMECRAEIKCIKCMGRAGLLVMTLYIDDAYK